MINFEDPHTRYLVDYVNLKQNLIKYQKNFLNKKDFNYFFSKKYLGVPLVLPLGIKYFDYSNINKFKISKKKVQKFIFNVKNSKYIGLKIFFRFGSTFCTGAKLKKKYTKHFNYIKDFNVKSINKLKKNRNSTKVAFQTRNIPHLGHLEIFKNILKKNRFKLFINPLIGMKKKGDCRNDVLQKVFKVLEKEYKNKIIFLPVIVNMNYCGPREALHHANIREKFGFDFFAVGRDHAGAENAYKPLDALKTVKLNKKNMKIKFFLHKGAYFCKKCNKVVLKDNCKHKNLTSISGTEYRKRILKKKKFEFEINSIQKVLVKNKAKVFY